MTAAPDMSREILEALIIQPIHQSLVAREYGKRDPKGTNPYRASSAGDCPRKLAFGLHHPELAEVPSARFGAIMDIGNALHEVAEKWLHAAGVEIIEMEQTHVIDILPGIKMRTRLDFIVKVGGKKVILDVKTMSDASFDNFVRSGMDKKHKAQLHCYAVATGVKRLAIFGINKNTGHIHIEYCDYDPAYMKEVRALFMQVKRSKPGALPDQMYGLVPWVKEYKTRANQHKNYYRMKAVWQCTYCSFFDACRADDQLQKTIEGGRPVWWRDMTREEKDAFFEQRNNDFAESGSTDEELELGRMLTNLGGRR